MPQAAASAKPLHIFKPGQWTTMAGEQIEFAEADLQATAAAYDPKVSKAPLVIGHPTTDKPAQGWARALQASPRGLFALADQVDPAFAESVNSGRYGTISAKFYRPTDASNPKPGVWYLRHIGFLGAQPPGVKGLDEPEFAEDAEDGEGVCFQEGMAFEPPPAAPLSHQPPQESAVTEEEAARLREENAEQARQLTELRERDAQRQAAQVLAGNAAFAETLVSEARIPTAWKDGVAAIGAHLQTAPPEVAFGEGDEKMSLHALWQDFLRALPKQVEFGEQATRERAAEAAANDEVQYAEGSDPERIAQDKAIRAYAKKHGMSYAAAANQVMRGK